MEVARLKKRSFDFDIIVNNEDLCNHFTGCGSKIVRILGALLDKIAEERKITSVKILNHNEQVLLTLIKLRRNLSNKDLAFRFGVSVGTVHNIFVDTVNVFHNFLFEKNMNKIPSREKNQLYLPRCFCPSYKNCRIVLDTTEISCDVPGNMNKQRRTWSSDKHRNTFKYLVGCAPNGAVTFCSAAYPGSTSDKAITEHSGIISQFVAGDLILADKDFLIADILPTGVSANLPPFLLNREFSENQVFKGRENSRARVHIERINERLKRFLILRHISHNLFTTIDRLVQLCCALVNLQTPILDESSKFFQSLSS